MPGISYINPYFRAPSPPKPFKSRPQGQNLLGFPLIAHSDHWGPVPAKVYLKNDGLAIKITKTKKLKNIKTTKNKTENGSNTKTIARADLGGGARFPGGPTFTVLR